MFLLLLCYSKYSHFSWPMTLNKQLPRTMVWASLPVQLSNNSVQLVWRESVKQLSTTPLNSFKRGNSWQRPCSETQHMQKKKVNSVSYFCIAGIVTSCSTTRAWVICYNITEQMCKLAAAPVFLWHCFLLLCIYILFNCFYCFCPFLFIL